MDRGSTPLTSTNRNSFTINIYVTQQFDEGMKEIALGLLAIGTAPFSADKIKDFLDKRPEPIEQKIDALDRVEDIMPSSSNFHRVADEYLTISGRKKNIDKMSKPQLIKFLHANHKDANLYNKGGLTKKNYVNPVKIVDNLK